MNTYFQFTNRTMSYIWYMGNTFLFPLFKSEHIKAYENVGWCLKFNTRDISVVDKNALIFFYFLACDHVFLYSLPYQSQCETILSQIFVLTPCSVVHEQQVGVQGLSQTGVLANDQRPVPTRLDQINVMLRSSIDMWISQDGEHQHFSMSYYSSKSPCQPTTSVECQLY